MVILFFLTLICDSEIWKAKNQLQFYQIQKKIFSEEVQKELCKLNKNKGSQICLNQFDFHWAKDCLRFRVKHVNKPNWKKIIKHPHLNMNCKNHLKFLLKIYEYQSL